MKLKGRLLSRCHGVRVGAQLKSISVASSPTVWHALRSKWWQREGARALLRLPSTRHEGVILANTLTHTH